MKCSGCGKTLSELALKDDACPHCGSLERETELSDLPLQIYYQWGPKTLTLVGIVYTALITIIGVVIAPLGWHWRVGYAVLALSGLVIGWYRRGHIITFAVRLLKSPGKGYKVGRSAPGSAPWGEKPKRRKSGDR
jgi:hypothetical protein